MSPHETSSNVEDMHALLHELNSLNELHVPDRTELFGVSVPGIFRNTANAAKAMLGHSTAKSATAAEKAWSSKDCSELQRREIMKATLTALTTWIDTANATDTIKLKDNICHIGKVDLLWQDAVFTTFPSAKPSTSA